MGMIVALILSTTPADGRSVAPLPDATPLSEVTCDGPLASSFLSPAANGLGVRAPLAPAKVQCTIAQPDGKTSKVELEFVDPFAALVLAADKPPVLGQDKVAVIDMKGPGAVAVGSAGPVTVASGQLMATLPESKMPQNLVVVAATAAGEPAFTIIPLQGRAKVALKTSKRAQLEAIVAGRRAKGFTADARGHATLSLPAPPGFTGGLVFVTDKKHKKTHEEISLPAAKPLYSLAVLGPSAEVAPGSAVTLFAAAANPAGLPATEDLSVQLAGDGQVTAQQVVDPGLWKIQLTAPKAGAQGTLTVSLGGVSKTVTVKASSAPSVAEAAPVVAKALTLLTSSADQKVITPDGPVAVVAQADLPDGGPSPEVIQVVVSGPGDLQIASNVPGRLEGKLTLKPGSQLPGEIDLHFTAGGAEQNLLLPAKPGAAKTLTVKEVKPDEEDASAVKVKLAAADAFGNAVPPEVTAQNGNATRLSDDTYKVRGTDRNVTLATESGATAVVQLPETGSFIHFDAQLEGGYLTNFGAISGPTPGLGLALLFRFGSFDVGLGADALYAHSSSTTSVPVDQATVSANTSADVLQALGGPYVRWHLNDLVAFDLTGGAGIDRVSEAIATGGQANSGAVSQTVAFGGLAGVELEFGLVRAMVGARYVTSNADSGLTGPSGGLAGLAAVGIDLGI